MPKTSIVFLYHSGVPLPTSGPLPIAVVNSQVVCVDGRGSAGSLTELGTEVGGSWRAQVQVDLYSSWIERHCCILSSNTQERELALFNFLFTEWCFINAVQDTITDPHKQSLVKCDCRKKTYHRRGVPRSLPWEIPGCCRPCPPIEPSCVGLETLRLTPLAPSLSFTVVWLQESPSGQQGVWSHLQRGSWQEKVEKTNAVVYLPSMALLSSKEPQLCQPPSGGETPDT